MTDKEKAIGILEAVAHWMKTSVFDYDLKDLDELLDEVYVHYKKHLKTK
jgi:hypothetical protein